MQAARSLPKSWPLAPLQITALLAWRQFGWRLYGKLGVDFREKGAATRMRKALQRNAFVTVLKINVMFLVRMLFSGKAGCCWGCALGKLIAVGVRNVQCCVPGAGGASCSLMCCTGTAGRPQCCAQLGRSLLLHCVPRMPLLCSR